MYDADIHNIYEGESFKSYKFTCLYNYFYDVVSVINFDTIHLLNMKKLITIISLFMFYVFDVFTCTFDHIIFFEIIVRYEEIILKQTE